MLGMDAAPPNLAALALRPLTADEYATFRERSHREYVEEIAANFGVSQEAAEERSSTQLDGLLPDGRDTADNHFLAIVDADDQLLGEIWLALTERLGGIEAFGFDFWVRPELRDAGIGRRAMQLAAAYAREQGAVRLALNVFGDNARARHLYESFGFRVTNTNMAMQLD
jgi:ribosomal protein S18 acetylase RimI-like enzyme